MMTTERRLVVVVGAGGHARVVAAILSQMADVELVGAADHTADTIGEAIGPTRVMTTIDGLSALRRGGVPWAALAVGDNQARANLTRVLQDMGFQLIVAQHPRAIVEPGCVVEDGTVICAGAILGAETRVGRGAIINVGAIVGHEGRIGAHAHVGPGARIAGRVTIGDGTLVGVGTTVKDSIAIGEWSVIGAGSVVVDHIRSRVVAYGVPARVQRDV